MEGLGLASWIQTQLRAIGLHRATPIQAQCIPAILAGRDVIGCAQTGSGKTLAFALPVLHTLSQDPYGIYALVLTPTRELAFQIADQFRVVGKCIDLQDCVVVGGRDMVTQGQALAKRPHIVIATPGRLADHMESCNTFSLKKIKYLIIDEADRMLGGDYDASLATIFRGLPAQRQTLLFTATITDSLQVLKEATLKDPFFFEDGSKAGTVEKLDQRYVLTPPEARDGYLVHVVQLCREKFQRGSIMIFVRTCKECEAIAMMLNQFDYRTVSLHSSKSQRERMAALSQFKSNQVRILVATDLASRGLDIPAIEFVINHDVPSVSKNYVHRVGRTARAGRGGMAITLVTPQDVKLIKAIEALTRTKLVELEVRDDSVAEILTQVNVTKREQEIKLDEQDFDEKRLINKRKRLILKGIDPDAKIKKERKRDKPSIKSSGTSTAN
eukprot:maker-scaffold217_size252476-snap-gene-1.38 protein:Tk00465 transcript:maker-scaffold217_size252476-snap-gene-1.38-mRNA-1 annotation:"probable atp-dependent rna helicase ddx49"